MTTDIDQLEPAGVWKSFKEISDIPRASGEEGVVLGYLRNFAQTHGLEYRQDRAGNMVIIRPADQGGEHAPTVVLQSHVDMVCEKNAKSSHDFKKDPIELKVAGEWLRAGGTSLGADNGIGVALMLSILSDRSLETGRLECLFTVEEETGLKGAMALEPEMIEGRTLINLDAEEAGVLYVGCAGGRESDIRVAMNSEDVRDGWTAVCMSVSGLRGGHSGTEIHLGRVNAVKLLSRILHHLRGAIPLRVVTIVGGDKANAIPREASAVVAVERGNRQSMERLFHSYADVLNDEMHAVEAGLSFAFHDHELPPRVFDQSSSNTLIDTLMVIPHGVLVMSGVMEGLVETSSNLASLKTEGNDVRIHACHRSSVQSALDWVCDVHTCISRTADASIEQNEGFPGWSPDPSSKVLGYAARAVEEVLDREAAVRAIHAGLECGVIKQKFEGMDAVSMGPTIEGPHSPGERVHIGSVVSIRKILIETLNLIRSG